MNKSFNPVRAVFWDNQSKIGIIEIEEPPIRATLRQENGRIMTTSFARYDKNRVQSIEDIRVPRHFFRMAHAIFSGREKRAEKQRKLVLQAVQ